MSGGAEDKRGMFCGGGIWAEKMDLMQKHRLKIGRTEDLTPT